MVCWANFFAKTPLEGLCWANFFAEQSRNELCRAKFFAETLLESPCQANRVAGKQPRDPAGHLPAAHQLSESRGS